MPAPLRVPVVRGIARGVLSGVMGEGGHAWQWQWIHGGAAASEEDVLRRLAPLHPKPTRSGHFARNVPRRETQGAGSAS